MSRFALAAVCGLLAMSGCTSQGPDAAAPSSSPVSIASTPHTEPPLPTGDPPLVPYVHGRRYVLPDGREEVLPTRDRGVSGVVNFAGGLLISDAAHFEGSNGLALVRGGELVENWPSAGRCSSGTPIASSDGRYVAWVTVYCPESLEYSTGAVHRATTDGEREVTVPIGSGLAGVKGFLGDRVVYSLGWQGGSWITDFCGPPRRIPGIDHVLDVSERSGLLIAQRGDQARLVVDAEGSVRWRLGGAGTLVAFSPDGSRVLALERRRLAVLRSSDGSVAAKIDTPAGVGAWSITWETDRTLLALMERAGRVAIVRLGIDGNLERVTPAVPAKPGRTPYVLLPPPPVPEHTEDH